MKYSLIFKEAERLHSLGLAIHWLHARSKRPVESGWTSGPRKPWEYLAETYSTNLNVGVRTGTPSKTKRGYLAVIDVDVKSLDPRHKAEALAAVKRLIGDHDLPSVTSGRGNGSRHYYCLTASPFKTFNPAESTEIVKVKMPSKRPSKAELKALSEDEIANGIRLANAWEISLYSDGRQVVLPPSVHPDSGELYRWKKPLTNVRDLPVLSFDQATAEGPRDAEGAGDEGRVVDAWEEELEGNGGDGGGPVREAHKAVERSENAAHEELDFRIEPVELSWLPISDAVKLAITEGKGVEDRSGYLLKASTALISAGLSTNEVLTVLTDPKTFLGAVGYDHAQTKDRARAAAWVYRYTFKKVRAERRAENVFGKASEMPKPIKLTEEEMEAVAAEFAEDWHWTRGLKRGGGGAPLKLIENVVLILENEVSETVVKRDEFAYRDVYGVNTPWGGKEGSMVTDDDVARIRYWLSRHFNFEPTENTISGALTVLACENRFDPVKDMLGNLPTWDGVPRLDTWLKNHFEAKGDAEYLAQVFRKWMFAMILRVYEPGAKFDWMPIFEGTQGIGKSSFGRMLVGDQHFLDWLPNLNDKDSALSLQGMWGVEMGELSQFRRNELENIKAFLTRTVDKLRPPYGRRLIESPRRCVFFGTTNRETYLTDETGNRRFKPVVVGRLDFAALARDRLQLFAEAKRLYDEKIESSATLELTGAARVYEKEIHSEKMVEDDSNSMKESMEDFIERIEAGKIIFNLSRFRIMDLFEGVGCLTKWKPENRNLQFAGKMLKKLGFKFTTSKGKKHWRLPDFEENVEKVGPPTYPKNTNDFREVSFI